MRPIQNIDRDYSNLAPTVHIIRRISDVYKDPVTPAIDQSGGGFKCKQYIGMLTLLASTTLGNSDANINPRVGGWSGSIGEILQQEITLFARGQI